MSYPRSAPLYTCTHHKGIFELLDSTNTEWRAIQCCTKVSATAVCPCAPRAWPPCAESNQTGGAWQHSNRSIRSKFIQFTLNPMGDRCGFASKHQGCIAGWLAGLACGTCIWLVAVMRRTQPSMPSCSLPVNSMTQPATGSECRKTPMLTQNPGYE